MSISPISSKAPEAGAIKDKRLKQACQDMESVFVGYMLKTMQHSTASEGWLPKNMGEDIKDYVEAIKTQFYKLLVHHVEEQKKKFIEDGGIEEEFVEEEDPYEQDIKDLLKRYRNLRVEYNKKQEVRKEENLQEKKNNEKFDQDDDPKAFSDCHARKTFITGAVKAMLRERANGKPYEYVFQSIKKGKVQEVSDTFCRTVERLGFNEGIEDNRYKFVFHTLRHTGVVWQYWTGA